MDVTLLLLIQQRCHKLHLKLYLHQNCSCTALSGTLMLSNVCQHHFKDPLTDHDHSLSASGLA